MSIRNFYPEVNVIPFAKRSVEMGAIISALKGLDYPVEVKRSAYIIVRNETRNGASVIGGTNFCGAQSDSGLWPDKFTPHIVATMEKNENLTGKMRGFIVFDTVTSGLDFLCDRVQAKGIFIGENVDARYHKGDVRTPDQLADAYEDEWVYGEDHNTTKSEASDFGSMYKQAVAIFAMLLLFIGGVSAQIDTIKTQILTSYLSTTLHEPLFVTYKLYKGGGDASRAGLTFKATPGSATAKDYAHNGYDEGHLANAEDFAYNKDLEQLTFFFYNCVPQTPRLNRGIWKTYETDIRKKSQSDSLLITCGSIFGSKKIGKAAVPTYCWKIVRSLTTGKILVSAIFPNDNSDTVEAIDPEDLQKRLDYKITF